MEFSAHQQDALSAVSDWRKRADQQVFRLFGYAGTGKTTLARHLSEGVEGEVKFAAFTGKAAHVLKQKGCPGASTIHSLIYRSREAGQTRLRELEHQMMELKSRLQAEGWAPGEVDYDPAVCDIRAALDAERQSVSRPHFTLNTESDIRHASLIVVDEVSMVDGQIGADLLWFGVPVLVLGDPAQLPPVMGSGYFTNHSPDFMLTEIHRQARESPIIRMATHVREGGRLEPGADFGPEARVIVRADLTRAMADSADQILVGRNATRAQYNARLRELRHSPPSWVPVDGERLICLRNNHEVGLLNGAQWEVASVLLADDDLVTMNLSPVDGEGGLLTVEAHAHYFRGEETKMAWWERKGAEEFDFGYAVTVHKAQGSQWDEVVLLDESFCFKADRARWLYTGITRAAERLTVVRV